MKKHVVQFEISVPNDKTESDLLETLKELLDLLEHKTSNLELDPTPQKEYLPFPPAKPYEPPTPWPWKDDINRPWRYKDDKDQIWMDGIKSYKSKLAEVEPELDKIKRGLPPI
jgi:hypothetical protein